MCSVWAACALVLAGPALAAELEARVDEQYKLTVCLRFSDDPVFSRFFTNSVERLVRGQLGRDFGPLVELEVVSGHAILGKAGEAGLAELTDLTDLAELTDLKTPPEALDETGLRDKLFLATIDYEAGQYRVQWQALDGEVGHVGPLRTRTTPDRWWLGKAICLAVRDDFAPVALVEPEPAGAEVGLKFRGAGLGPRLGELLAGGCVLQPYRVVRRQGGRLTREPIPYTVLRIEPGGATGRARVVSALPDPWRRTARVAGFQAVKLNTCPGRFRLRLVDADTGSPVQSCQVYAHGEGFDQIGDADRLGPPDRRGWVVAPRPFDGLAYIRITQSGGAVSRILLPITDAWCEEVCRLRVDERAADKAELDRRATVLVQDVQVLEGMLDQHVRQLNRLNEKRQYEEALDEARTAGRSVGSLLETARRDVADLRARAADLDRASDSRLAWAARQVEAVGKRLGDLGEIERDLGRTIHQRVALNQATVQARLAEDLVKQGDVDQAIANYREAVRLSPQPAFRQRLDELESTWRIKDDEHRQARAFVFETWPAAAVDQWEPLEPEAERAFRKLVEVDDHLAAWKLLKATGEHLRELSDLVEMLSQRDTEADRQACRKYISLTERMARFHLEVGEYVAKRSGERQPPAEDKTGQAAPPAR